MYSLEIISEMSKNELLKNFTVNRGDEYKRKYSYLCKLIPENCTAEFTSFGNETKARIQMLAHLALHITQISKGSEPFFAESIVSRKRKIDKELKLNSQKLKCGRRKKTNKEISSENESNDAKPNRRTYRKRSNQYNSSLDIQWESLDSSTDKTTESLFHFQQCLVRKPGKNKDKQSNSKSSTCSEESNQNIEYKLPECLYDHTYASYNSSQVFDKSDHLSFKKKFHFNWDNISAPKPNHISSLPYPFLYCPNFPNVCQTIDIQEAQLDAATTYKLVKSDEIPVIADYRKEKENSQFSSSIKKPFKNQIKEQKDSAWEKKYALMCIRKLEQKSRDFSYSQFCNWKCEICTEKSFTAYYSLIYHYRGHAGIKPFYCELCEAEFTRLHSLKYHMLIHNNTSRFKCKVCGREFRHQSHFKEHMRRHTGETPFECSDCHSRFKTRNTYKRHLKFSHGKLLTAAGIIIMSNEDFEILRAKRCYRKKELNVEKCKESVSVKA